MPLDREIKLNVSNPDEWETYKNTAKRDVIFASMAYKHLEKDSEKLDSLSSELPEGFQMIFFTDFLDDTKAHEFRSAVFINHETNEVIVSASGTRFGLNKEGIADLAADSYLAFEEEPPIMKSMKELNTMLLDSLGEDAGKYKFHYTGHSLGAAVADMGAADLAIKMRKRNVKSSGGSKVDISTMTFENPGARKIIEKMYEREGLDPKEYSEDVDYKGMNNRMNIVNRTSAPAGKMWEVIPDSMGDLNMAQLFLLHVSQILESRVPIIARIVETVAYGAMSSQLDAHSLKHFKDVLCDVPSEEGKAEGATVSDIVPVDRSSFFASEIITGCKRVLFDLGIFKEVKQKHVTNGFVGKQEFEMVSPDGKLVTASNLELSSAVKVTKSLEQKDRTIISSNDRSVESSDIKLPVRPTAEEAVGAALSISRK